MSIQIKSLPLPPSANSQFFAEFGKEIKGVNPADLTPEQFKEIEQLLYKVFFILCLDGVVFSSLLRCQHSLLLFRNAIVSPEQQYAITKASICAPH
jgi:hypothetical protein